MNLIAINGFPVETGFMPLLLKRHYARFNGSFNTRVHPEVGRSRLDLRQLKLRPQRCYTYKRSLSTATNLTLPNNTLAQKTVLVTSPSNEQLNSSRDTSVESAVSAFSAQPPALLPVSCPGCGALSQETDSQQAGFYTRSRKAVRQYLHYVRLQNLQRLKRQGDNLVEDEPAPSLEESKSEQEALKTSPLPMCDRCHDLIYYSRGQPIAHPSLEDIADSIAESPFRRNHIIHVVDAADFPLSVVPSFMSKLNVAKQRSQNRRSQHDFSSRPTLSFVITRSDLLGPTKEMVDSMMPYFQRVLRDALGRVGQDMRLGNVHLVSAKRGWWTKEIKEEIWKRGGGTWMVGKFNVGKSNLFEVLFPKGSGDRAPVYTELKEKTSQEDELVQGLLLERALLPPPQDEVPFPVFPLVSDLPGTTASPIRLPFGNGRGELIDLPGLERGTMEEFVRPDRKTDLIMQTRQNVEQYIIKPGQSLILGGGLIRITPQLSTSSRDATVLAFPFVPLKAHVTSTEKAIAQQTLNRESGIESIIVDSARQCMASAGTIGLTTDVTRSYAGPLLRAGVPITRLPFKVYATDILIEGVGWVELSQQVRLAPRRQPASTDVASEGVPSPDPLSVDGAESDFAPFSDESNHVSTVPQTIDAPTVEVFSPNGKHVSSRPSLGAWTKWSEHQSRTARRKSGTTLHRVVRRRREVKH